MTLTDIITTALQVPGVKVDRATFLKETFKTKPIAVLEQIVQDGPIEAGCSREELKEIAKKLMNERVMVSAGMSFAAGLPGGLAIAATIPADLVQFYGTALRMAQELIYLYGEPDLWQGGKIDNKRVVNRLILYIGVMLSVGGAEAAVRVMASAMAKKALAKLPRQAMMKHLIYRVIKSVARAFGVRMNKEVFAKGVAKVIPVIGGIISGGLTFATMRPMGLKLMNALDEAHFDYNDEKAQRDWDEVIEICEQESAFSETEAAEENETDLPEDAMPFETDDQQGDLESAAAVSIVEEINQANQLMANGIISEEEFAQIKSKLISRL
ncbi:MAG: bacteriochlorophyll 4-vinyl reductase [Clostridia bacterium]|nr:bacteriochlorophyll 4-vinyl reductase [Clostridia bacterium]